MPSSSAVAMNSCMSSMRTSTLSSSGFTVVSAAKYSQSASVSASAGIVMSCVMLPTSRPSSTPPNQTYQSPVRAVLKAGHDVGSHSGVPKLVDASSHASLGDPDSKLGSPIAVAH